MRSRFSLKIICLCANLLCDFGVIGFDRAEYTNQLFDFPAIQQTPLVDLHPSFLLSFFIGEQPTSHFPKMLASVVQIDNLDGSRKVQGDKIPNPFRAVADDHLLECTAPATFPSFSIDSPAKLFRALDRSGIGGGIGIADGRAFLIPLWSG